MSKLKNYLKKKFALNSESKELTKNEDSTITKSNPEIDTNSSTQEVTIQTNGGFENNEEEINNEELLLKKFAEKINTIEDKVNDNDSNPTIIKDSFIYKIKKLQLYYNDIYKGKPFTNSVWIKLFEQNKSTNPENANTIYIIKPNVNDPELDTIFEDVGFMTCAEYVDILFKRLYPDEEEKMQKIINELLGLNGLSIGGNIHKQIKD